jgi:hypothetical protein
MEYKDQLKSPKWQKKRLEVLSRDEFTCKMCGDKETELQVHHMFYKPKAKPWEYPINSLQTLCSNCHTKLKGRKFCEVTEDGGFINPYDFLIKYPFVNGVFSEISDHEGIWNIRVIDNVHFVTVLVALKKLKDFIGYMDFDIYEYNDNRQEINIFNLIN